MATPLRDAARNAITGNPVNPSKKPETTGVVNVFELADELINELRDLAQIGVKPPRESVRLLMTTNVTIASALENGDTLDGETLVTGDRIALTGQSTGSQNGVYVVQASGAAVRSTDMDTADELLGSVFSVEEGSRAGETWAVQNTGEITLGTTSIVITKTQASSPFNNELLDARGTADTLGDRLDDTDTTTEELEADALRDRERAPALLDRDTAFSVHFSGANAFAVRRSGKTLIAAREVPKVATWIEAGDLYASHAAFPAITRRLTHSGDIVWCDGDDHFAHYVRKLGNDDVIRDAFRVSSMAGIARSAQSTLGSGITDLVQFLVIGQSVSAGGVQVQADIVTSSPEDETRLVMFTGGARVLDGALERLAPSAHLDYDPTIGVDEVDLYAPGYCFDELVGMKERFVGITWGETPVSGVGRQMLARLPSTTAILGSAHGVGSTPLADYRQGTTMYDNMMKAVEYGKLYATMYGLTHRVAGVFWVGGEESQNAVTSNNYRDQLVAFQAELDDDIKAISGQAQEVVLVLSQLSSWTKLAGLVTTSNIMQGVFDAARVDNTKIKLAGPRYSEVHTAEGVHLPGASTKIVGERGGRVLAQVVLGTDIPIDLYAVSASASGTTLTITMSREDLDWYTSLVTDPGQYGFRVIVDSGTTPTLSSFNIVGDTITCTMSTTLTGGQNPRLGIADFAASNAGTGPTAGPRSPLASESTDEGYDERLLHYFVQSQRIAISV